MIQYSFVSLPHHSLSSPSLLPLFPVTPPSFSITPLSSPSLLPPSPSLLPLFSITPLSSPSLLPLLHHSSLSSPSLLTLFSITPLSSHHSSPSPPSLPPSLLPLFPITPPSFSITPHSLLQHSLSSPSLPLFSITLPSPRCFSNTEHLSKGILPSHRLSAGRSCLRRPQTARTLLD